MGHARHDAEGAVRRRRVCAARAERTLRRTLRRPVRAPPRIGLSRGTPCTHIHCPRCGSLHPRPSYSPCFLPHFNALQPSLFITPHRPLNTCCSPHNLHPAAASHESGRRVRPQPPRTASGTVQRIPAFTPNSPAPPHAPFRRPLADASAALHTTTPTHPFASALPWRHRAVVAALRHTASLTLAHHRHSRRRTASSSF